MVEESPELADKVMDMSDRDFEDETIVGIQKQYDAVVHYDQKTVNK